MRRARWGNVDKNVFARRRENTYGTQGNLPVSVCLIERDNLYSSVRANGCAAGTNDIEFVKGAKIGHGLVLQQVRKKRFSIGKGGS